MGCCTSVQRDEPNEEAADNFINPYRHILSESFLIERVVRATNSFSENLLVGRGGSASVYRCVINGNSVAVKRLTNCSEQGDIEFGRELNCLSTLNHVNVIRLVGYSVSALEKILIYEYMNNGSLASFFRDDNQRSRLDWSKRVAIIKGIACGLRYLHNDATVIHRDIKASNILLNDQYVPKIADFGTVKNVNDGNLSPPKGTLGYWDPQYNAYGRLSTKTDIFSFGMIILELLTGKRCLAGDGSPHLSNTVWEISLGDDWMTLADASLERNTVTRRDFGRMMQIAMLCVQNDIEPRPTSEELVNMLESPDTELAIPTEPMGIAPEVSADGVRILPNYQVE